MIQRPRRLRQTATLRSLVQETTLSPSDLVYPLFIESDDHAEGPILSLPGQSRLGLNKACHKIEQCLRIGVQSFALFPVIAKELKDPTGREAKNKLGTLPRAIREIKKRFPESCLFSDVALDPYSSDGHDGLIRDGKILNDESLPVLAEMALVQAEAGVDFVAPSDMMDGRVGFLRTALDQAGFCDTGILAYTAKYASSFYGPFREALDSTPQMGDKKTYQMNPANRREALREARLDVAEGADIVMVKPGLCYLDIIRELKNRLTIPVAGYNVSGEYAMVKAAAKNQWINEYAAAYEILISLKRAGCNVIFTYHADEIGKILTTAQTLF